MSHTEQTTTITVTKKVRTELARLGAKDDSFNDIIQRLIEEHKSKKGV